MYIIKAKGGFPCMMDSSVKSLKIQSTQGYLVLNRTNSCFPPYIKLHLGLYFLLLFHQHSAADCLSLVRRVFKYSKHAPVLKLVSQLGHAYSYPQKIKQKQKQKNYNKPCIMHTCDWERIMCIYL